MTARQRKSTRRGSWDVEGVPNCGTLLPQRKKLTAAELDAIYGDALKARKPGARTMKPGQSKSEREA